MNMYKHCSFLKMTSVVGSYTVVFSLAFNLALASQVVAEPVKIFILAGSSNMMGFGPITEIPDSLMPPQEDVWMWHDFGNVVADFVPLGPGFGRTGPNAEPERLQHGPELTLGRTLADAFPDDQVALVKHVGLRALAKEWHPDTPGPTDGNFTFRDHNYAFLTHRMEQVATWFDIAGLTFEVAGLFWEVGADARSEDEALAYQKNFEYLISSVREDFANDSEMPFVVGRSNFKLSRTDDRPHWEIVREAQVHVADADPFGGWVDGDDLSTFAFADPHYDSAGSLELGRRMANEYIGLVPHLFAVPGDANLDGGVDFSDFLLLSRNFGLAGNWRDGDFDDDGLIQFSDFLILSTNFGQSDGEFVAQSESVPEPSSRFLAFLGVVLLSRRNSRQLN